MDVISRKDARSAGFKHYFTGASCKHGHVDRRFVSSCRCMACARSLSLETYWSLTGEKRERQLARNRVRTQKWYAEHRDQQLAYQVAVNKARKETHPDYFRDHYAKHRERRKRESQAWYRANSDRALERQRAYDAKRLAENPEHVRAIGRRHANTRRAIKKRVFVEVVDPIVVFERDKGRCGICMKPVARTSRWEVDHIIPISKGGAHAYDNVQLAHLTCNRSKSARLPRGQPTLFQVVPA